MHIPSELFEPAMAYLIGSAVQGVLSGVDSPTPEGPTVWHGSTLERLSALDNWLSAFGMFASQVKAVHASIACANLQERIMRLVALERQEPGSVLREQRKLEESFAHFAKTGELLPEKQKTKGRKTK